MRVHHLNCISGRLAAHCLLVESNDGLVLVDTGHGLRDVHHAKERLSRFLLVMTSPDLREQMTAARQIEALGHSTSDVRHIVLTHLDFDHAGGLDDFPNAVVHMLEREREAAFARPTVLDKMRYRPAQWSTRERWLTYGDDDGDDWFGFRAVRGLVGLPPEIALVPLYGHTFGHAGVAVRLETRWLLLAGDAYFDHDEMDLQHPRCTPALRAYQTLLEKDRPARLENQHRLRELARAHRDDVTIVCSHDPIEFERLAGRPLDVPLGLSKEGDELHAFREIEAQSY
jgi:glyoxylase-like metal-dependent hydrolase (beta-lactamase superfamily II)